MADGDEQRDADSGQDESPDSTDQESLIDDEERAEDGQVYVERDNLDFDPEEGLYSGTAVHGGTDIPGPHEQVDDIDPNESGGETEDDGDSDSDSDSDSDDSDE
jgi:hypothetical protein